MNIIFMGTPQFAVPSLEILLSSHHNISAVVTVPDKPQGRGLKLAESPVKKFALLNNLKVLQPDNLAEKSFIEDIKSLSPDLIVVVAFRILPKEVYSIPRFSTFNLHASLLPKYRGAAPINWAIINGEKETGVTTFFLTDKVDTGKIIIQNKCEITEDDDAGSLHDKLARLGANTVMSTVSLVEMTNGSVPVYEQDNSIASKAPKIFKEFCRINFNIGTDKVFNFIRGLSPYPAAYTFREGKQIKIFKARMVHNAILTNGMCKSPGQAVPQEGRLFITCLDGYLEILEMQLEGKKRMTASDFLRGYDVKKGEIWS
jgi:methionyl-tRNA formyltransferase